MSLGVLAAVVAVLALMFKSNWMLGLAAVIFLVGSGTVFTTFVSSNAVVVLIVLIILFALLKKK